MRHHRSTPFRSSRASALAVIVLSITLGFSPVIMVAEPATAAEPITASATESYPRLMAWWPDVHSLSPDEIARYDSVILYDWAGPQATAIKAADPDTEVFVSTSACELTMYTEVAPEPWKNAKLAAASARWCVTQPGSTLVTGIGADTTTISVATVDSDRFRAGDVLVIDEEFLEVQAVNGGSPGSLVVRRGAVVAGARHAAVAHAAGARVAAVVREFPNTVLMDLTDRCPLVDVGNGPEDFGSYLARVSAAAASDPVWDGIYFDMIESEKTWVLYAGFARGFDLDRTNAVPGDTAAFNAAWADGVRSMEQKVRTLVGEKPILTNGAEANWDLINGTSVERFPMRTTTPADWHARVFGSQYVKSSYFAGLSGRQPNYSTVLTYDQETDPATPLNSATWRPDYRKMRLGLTTTLLGDGLYTYGLGTAMCEDISQLQWFDEYDNAGAGGGYLGSPLGAAVQVAPATSAPDLLNGDGSFGTATQLGTWSISSSEVGYSATKSLDSGAARVDVTGALGTAWKLAFQHPVQVTAGNEYTLTFRMKADRATDVQVFAQIASSPYAMPLNFEWVEADTEWRTYTLTAISSATLSPTLRFLLGSAPGTIWIDDVQLRPGGRNDVWRRDFDNGVALVNATSAPVTVDLGGEFRKIDGTQDRTVNDGSLVTSVTLPAMDGIIVLREGATDPEPDLEPTSDPEPVANVAPIAVIAATPGTGTAPLAVSFNGSGSTDSDGTIVSYRWEFGDGTTQTGPSASHTYTAAGTYTAKLTVTDDDGAIAAVTKQIVVGAPAPVVNAAPTAVIAATPGTGTAPVTVSFNGSGSTDSDGAIASYRWEFGDGTTQTGSDASHVYTAAGTYTAKLTVTDDGGATASATTKIVVSDSTSTDKTVGMTNVHRFLNKKNGTHFLTASAEERDAVMTTLSSVYAYEGVAYSADPAKNTQPLYRFYNRSNGTHFYTASKVEADGIVATLSSIYTLDGQAYNVSLTPVEGSASLPVYRFYNLANGAHFYTASTQERDEIIAKWSATLRYEGPAFWLAQ